MVTGYDVTETLREDERVVLRRAIRSLDRRPVLLKSPTSKHPAPAIVRQLEHERDIGAALPATAVLRPIALERRADRVVLVLDHFAGVPLSRLLGAPLPIDRFLRIALATARALGELHEHHVIHKDIRPESILVDAGTDEVRITELGLASLLPREYQHAAPASLIEGSLPYLSPEQTGRMHRAIDDRTDLYSLGITFHQMLTGRLPFAASDPLEWVHCHLAGEPAAPHDIDPRIPEPLSAIVLRLLAKAAEGRYQTARGLEHDLERCLAAWTDSQSIPAFPLGSADCSEWFHVPQQLYGRDRETRMLLDCFERVATAGKPELVLVSGYAGIGKSSLVQELQKPLSAARGLYLAGKFDEKKRDVPYSTVVQAFGQLVRQMLTEDDGRIAAWRGRLLAALGANAQLIVDLVPELELVIGAQPAVPRLSMTEERNRFYLVFRRFLGVFASHERPLLLFLDDLQWADAGSLSLIEHLVTHADTRGVLLVGACRDNEVGPTHPLALTLAAIRAAGAAVCEIALGPLSPEDLRRLVADTLRCDAARAEPLAALVGEKTGRNPFFVLQFLTMLHERALLVFDRKARSWSWDLGRIQAENHTDNVIDLMTGRVNRLPPEARTALMQAACAGDEVPASTLAAIARKPADDVHRDLWAALRDGLMIRVGDVYRFSHDRVRQAAYLRIPEADRAGVHLAIARALLAATRPEDQEARVFELVTQFNLGRALIDDPAERARVARLDLVAGRRARASTAYQSAIHHLSAGIELLAPDPFAVAPDLAWDLHFELAASVYLHGCSRRAAALLSELEPRSATKLRKAAVRRLEVDLYTSTDQLDEAVARGVLGLSLFGIDIPPHPPRAEVERGYDRVWRLLGDRPIEALIDLPPMKDPEICAAQDILAVLFAPALNTDPNLPLLVYCTMVENSLVHGNSEASALAYAYFGMSLGPAFGRYQEGHRFGKLGYDLMERQGTSAYKAKISVVFGDNTLFWTHHLENDLAYLDTAFRAAQESGDVTFACYCCNRIVADRFFLGHALDDVFAEAERRSCFTRSARFDASTQAISAIERVVEELRGSAAPSAPPVDEGAYEALMDRYPWAVVTCWYYIMKLVSRVLWGDWESALGAAARARALLWSTLAHSQEPEYWYYGALALAGRHDGAGAEERPALIASLREHEQKLAAWSRTCPENFRSKHALVAAELSRIEDRPLDAMRLYDEAAQWARQNGYVQNEAIANEAAARFHLARGAELIAAAYLREAMSGYAQWGAHAKVAELERRYATLREPSAAPPPTAIVARPEQLDLLAVLRASQAISGEIDLGRLLEALVRTVMQHAAARRGLLLLAHGDELRAEAEASWSPTGVRVLLQQRKLAEVGVPASVVNYVGRSRRTVILDDAAQPNLFSADPVVAARPATALLCMPILRQTKVVGVLYLESDVRAGAWPPARLAALELLASQAAISLENAAFYAALRRSEELLRAIVDNSTTAIYVKDLEGRYLLVNRVVEQLLGVGAESVIGRTDDELLPRSTADDVRTHDRRVIEAMAPMEWEETIPLRGGARTYLSVKFPLRDGTGGVWGSCGISTDITQRVEAERERARLLREAQEALRIRDEFLSIASHELKTPLTPLCMQVQLLGRRLANPKLGAEAKLEGLDRLVAVSAHSVERLSRLVGELLDVSRISSGKLALHPEEVDLAALVREIVEGFHHDLTSAGCALDLVAEEHVTGRWDRFRLEQVVLNLLSNAVKYGAGRPISVAVRRAGAAAEVVVRDEGIGVPREAQARIFERFERAVPSRSFGGLGLGLYIARQIVEAHGGSIRVESDPPRGATFTIELPLDAP